MRRRLGSLSSKHIVGSIRCTPTEIESQKLCSKLQRPQTRAWRSSARLRLAEIASPSHSQRRLLNASCLLLGRYDGRSSGSVSSLQPTMSNRSSSSGSNVSFNVENDLTSHYVIALGSNIGDRFAWIEKACLEMEASNIRIYATSSLFQTSAMYVENQDDFLNGVCMVETKLDPLQLMKKLQGVENRLGRVKVVDKGPRNIDLDILLWHRGRFEKEVPDLRIPHKLMGERDFVLGPLCQLIPATISKDDLSIPHAFIETNDRVRYSELLDRLWGVRGHQDRKWVTPPISTRIPLSKSLPPLNPSQPDRSTHVMAILNLTPDSFSDGGQHAPENEEYLRTTILHHLHAGATIIDLGGQSSRPGAVDISPEQETKRLRPALKILSSLRQDPNTPPFGISIDTYRAAVAEAAIREGADIINDISAGTLDEDMLPTIARLGCTYIMMHMRGTPATMTSKDNCTYEGDLVQTIKAELVDRVAAAEAAGIRRWRLILDPGIGFAKTAAQNLEILRRMGEFTSSSDPDTNVGRVVDGAYRSLDGIPWLVGASRKGFIGKITGVENARERAWGTAATVTAAVAGGADIVRVHDTVEMGQVVKMSDAIHRVKSHGKSRTRRHEHLEEPRVDS